MSHGYHRERRKAVPLGAEPDANFLAACDSLAVAYQQLTQACQCFDQLAFHAGLERIRNARKRLEECEWAVLSDPRGNQ